jgi:L-lactate utilization protein LutC
MAIIKRNKSTIYGLNDQLAQLAQGISDETTARQTVTGDLINLTTTDKTSLVKAINEASKSAGDLATEALYKAQNLGDLENVETARTNLNVYSSVEVDDAIEVARLALGTNFTVAVMAERDALTDLDGGDRVFVRDVGDTTWGLYKPVTFDEVSGAVTDWMLLYGQAQLENSATAEGVKEAYESNVDTNAFNDASKVKVDNITVSGTVDLDDAVFKADLVQDIETNPDATQAPSADAVKTYAQAAVAQGGGIPLMESVIVVGDEITLTQEPRGGVNGIMNFGTVRYMDANNSAFDAPVIATADPKVFVVSADSEGQWNGNTVKVQYIYTPSAV